MVHRIVVGCRTRRLPHRSTFGTFSNHISKQVRVRKKEIAVRNQKTPEMNELETDKVPLKICAYKFEKQKSLSILKFKKKVVSFVVLLIST